MTDKIFAEGCVEGPNSFKLKKVFNDFINYFQKNKDKLQQEFRESVERRFDDKPFLAKSDSTPEMVKFNALLLNPKIYY
jgi:hypothetical protein